MGILTRLIVFVSIFTSITLTSNSQYLLPITKHEPTKQFYTTFNIEATTTSPVNLVFDLGTNLALVDCDKVTSIKVVPCQSSTCKSIPGSYCGHDGLFCLYGQSNLVVQDRVFISTTDGGKFLHQVSFDNFTFSCADKKTKQDFPPPLSGVLSLSPFSSSFAKQVTSAFRVPPKFSLCLPSSGTGHFYIAGDHYFIPPFSDNSRPIPMTSTPMSFTDSGDYFFVVESIYLDGTPIPISGLAKLSTVVPYTELVTHIYNDLAQSFTLKAKAMGISTVPSVAPFKRCFDARTARMNMTGPNVPVIEIGLWANVAETSKVKWAFYGANTLVKMNETVMCLAFIDGGNNPEDVFSMVIGTHQLQDFMIEFDFKITEEMETFSFSESLLLHNISCSTCLLKIRINHT